MGRLIDTETLYEELESNLDLTRKYTIQQLFDAIYERIDAVPSISEWKDAAKNPPNRSGRYLALTDIGSIVRIDYSSVYKLWNCTDNFEEPIARFMSIPVICYTEVPIPPLKFRRKVNGKSWCCRCR